MIVESNNKDSLLSIFNVLREATGQQPLDSEDIVEDSIVELVGDSSKKKYTLFKIKGE